MRVVHSTHSNMRGAAVVAQSDSEAAAAMVTAAAAAGIRGGVLLGLVVQHLLVMPHNL
jgi:hypothetical protein